MRTALSLGTLIIKIVCNVKVIQCVTCMLKFLTLKMYVQVLHFGTEVALFSCNSSMPDPWVNRYRSAMPKGELRRGPHLPYVGLEPVGEHMASALPDLRSPSQPRGIIGL